jgi:hypothetical protein
MENIPKKLVRKGRKSRTTETCNDFCRFCSCSFKVKFGNTNKTSFISTENVFKLSDRKVCPAHITSSLGLLVQSSSASSDRVCKPCGRKIRTTYEYFQFIKTGLDKERRKSNTDVINIAATSPERYKRRMSRKHLSMAFSAI